MPSNSTRAQRSRLRLAFPPILVAAALTAACSGAAESDLYNSPSTSTNGSGSDGGPDKGNSGDGGGGDDGSVSVSIEDATTNPERDARPRNDSGETRETGAVDTGADDTGTTPDASDVDTGTPDAGTVDSGLPPHDPATINCGPQQCTVPTQECCRTRNGITNETIYACVPAGQGACLGVSALTIPCDDAADCTTLGETGAVCCVSTTGSTSAVNDVRCRLPQDCDQPSRRILCDPGLANVCPFAPNVSCKRNTSASFDFTLCSP